MIDVLPSSSANKINYHYANNIMLPACMNNNGVAYKWFGYLKREYMYWVTKPLNNKPPLSLSGCAIYCTI